MLQRLCLLALPATLALVVLAAMATADPAPTEPAPAAPASASAEGVLLLRSGRMLAGRIRRDGDRFFVTLGTGEIRVRAEEVERVCPTLADVCEYKRAAMLPGSVGPHLDLSAWCIANGLWNEAQRELNEARRLEPRHPKIPLLERRLATDRQAAATSKAVSAQEALDEQAAGQPEDRDELLAGLSKAAMESFTTSVQPILQNTCSAAGCHGPSATSSFRLVRLAYGQPTNQRTTRQNLQAVLRLVDRNQPAKSPLLMTPIRPHGTAKDAIFKGRDTARYRQLVNWVNQVTRGTSVADKTEPDPHPPLLQAESHPDPAPHPGTRKGREPLKPAGFQTPVPNDNATGPSKSEPDGDLLSPQGARPEGARLDGARPQQNLPRGPIPQGLFPSGQAPRGAPQGFTPRDEFDPEIFNRRYFPGRG